MFFNSLFNNLNITITEISLTHFYFDVIFLQFIIFYTFYLLYSASNIYYVLVYLFLQILYFGLILSILQLELFTGFLWVTELTILFIFLLLCFYLNAEGNFNYSNKKIANFFIFYLFVILLIFFNYGFTETTFLNVFNYIDIWDDFYEAFNNSLMTDFYGLFIIYYLFNSVFTLFIFLLLFICSVICVVLNKVSKISKKQNIGNYLSIFNFFNNFTNYIFYRKQNLIKQNIRIPATKIFKKK